MLRRDELSVEAEYFDDGNRKCFASRRDRAHRTLEWPRVGTGLGPLEGHGGVGDDDAVDLRGVIGKMPP